MLSGGLEDGETHLSMFMCQNSDSILPIILFSRICPGRFMAFSSMWIAVANMIAVFDIEKSKDYDGNIIEPTMEYVSSLI